MNLASLAVVAAMTVLRRRNAATRGHEDDHDHEMNHGGGTSPKRVVAYLCLLLPLGGFVAYVFTARL